MKKTYCWTVFVDLALIAIIMDAMGYRVELPLFAVGALGVLFALLAGINAGRPK